MFQRSLKAFTSGPKLRIHTFTPAGDHARQLLDEFSQPKDHRDQNKLHRLGLGLTPSTVESVLKGLRGWKIAHEFFSWAESQPRYKHNCYTYNTFASILAQSKRNTQLRTLANNLVAGHYAMSPGALGFFLRCLGNLGLVEEAQFVFDSASNLSCVPNVYTYNCLLEVFAKAGHVDFLELRLQEMKSRPGLKPDKFTLTSLLRCYCNVGRLDNAMEILDIIESNNSVDVHVLTILIVAFCKWGKIEKTCELVGRMETHGMHPNEKTFIVLIHGFVKQGRVDKAQEMFDKMIGLGFVGDFPLYSALIEGLCEKKELPAALVLFEEMRSKGILPNTRLVRKLVSTFCEQGELETACKLFAESAKNLKSGSIISICNATLEGLVNSDQITQAYCLLNAMIRPREVDKCKKDLDQQLVHLVEGVKPNDDSFNTVICGLCKYKKLDDALNLLNDMVILGCKGKLLMYNNLIDELCKVDRLEESYKLFEKMKELCIFPTEFSYNSLFFCHSRRKDTSGALALIQEMCVHGYVPWVKHSTMLVKGLCVSGKTEEASMFLSEMLKLGILPDMIPYSAVIDGLCKSGCADKGLELFQDLCNKNYLPDVVAHNILINGFLKSGNWNKAEGVLEEMVDKGLSPSVVTYNLMIDGLFKTNNPEKALSYFNKMNNEEILPNVITYTSLIDGLLGFGRPETVMDIWDEMKQNGVIPNKVVYTALVHGFCKCGLAQRALGFYHEMKEKGFEIDVYGRFLLVNTLIFERMSLEAFELLSEFFQRRVPFFSANCKTTELVERAVCKLYRDHRTSEQMRNLIERGLIPTVNSVQEINNML
jgi:pentatricopeptide repeat protein